MKNNNILAIALLMYSFNIAEAKELELEKLLSNFDDLYRSSSSISQIEMKIETLNWSRTLLMNSWSEGTDKTFVRILKPRKEKGVATLKKGTEVWNYFPKINKIIKVPASMMMGSWMGSDLTNDDLVKEHRLSVDYTFKGVEEGDEVIVTLIPKEKTVTLWGKIELYINKKTNIPSKEIFFDEKSKKIRQINFKEIKQIDGRIIPTVMEIIPLNKKGNKTVIKYIKIDFKTKIPKRLFTRKNLQKRI